MQPFGFDTLSVSTEMGRRILAERNALAPHSLFSELRSLDQLRTYMRYHVWCVWDFMALLKSVQAGLGSFSTAWLPARDAELLHLVNSIVAEEELDTGPDGRRLSHFEAYIQAMRELDVPTGDVEEFVELLRGGTGVIEAMTTVGAPAASIEFVSSTLGFCALPLHQRVAAFTLGREELVPHLLQQIRQHDWFDVQCGGYFAWYVDRHIELDLTAHGPKSVALASGVIGDDSTRRDEALITGLDALRARRRYLDAIEADIGARARSIRGASAAAAQVRGRRRGRSSDG